MSFYVVFTATQRGKYHNPNFTDGETEDQGGCLPGSGIVVIERSELFLPINVTTSNPISICSSPGKKMCPPIAKNLTVHRAIWLITGVVTGAGPLGGG